MTKRVHRNAAGAVQIAVARFADQPASLTFGKGNFSPAIGLHDRTVGGIVSGSILRFGGMSGHRLIWFCADSVAIDLKRITGQKGITTNPSIDSAGGYTEPEQLRAILGLSA